jgi:hypothetical protein
MIGIRTFDAQIRSDSIIRCRAAVTGRGSMKVGSAEKVTIAI